MFTSDNGGLSTAEGSPTCNLPLREGKGWIEQGGIRVSLIMKIPGINIKKSDFPVISNDFYPTILDILELPKIPEQHKDGISFLPILKGENIKRPLFFHWPHYGNQGGTPSSAIIYDSWKLVYSYQYEKYLIFNLNEDIEEKNDLINKNPKEFKILKELLWDYIKDTGAKLPEKNE
ncbi:MAG: hypothetical protein NC816_00125 [Candidatus Omnitrophica bacterium]|nr:hypothetical protein [Candidatus Omnitrophota bacterium]